MKEKVLFFVAMELLVFQVIISMPITIWLHNQFNFNIALLDAVGIMGFIFLASTVLLLLFAFIIPEKIRGFLLPIFLLVSVLVYIQQNILVWDYGVIDGNQVDFSANSALGLIDAGLWISGLAATILLRKQIVCHARNILTFMVVLTLLATIVPVVTHDFSSDKTSASLTEADKFAYSAKKNIFLFIFDAYQSDLFWDIIDHNMELKAEFDGFTFYPNATAVFAKTYPTIPLLLTGRKYQKQQPFKEFIRTAYDDSMLTALVDQGWDVGLYPYVRATIALDESIMSNYADRAQLPERIMSYLQALDLSLFRAVPHFLKSRIYTQGDFRLGPYFADELHNFDGPLKTRNEVTLPKPHPHRELNFLHNLKTLATDQGANPVFRFYHFYMPHGPFLLNRELKYDRMPYAFTSYREYAFAAVKVMTQVIAQLKNLGIYDQSAIIIAADHGGGEYGSRKYISSADHYVSIPENGNKKASGKPLFLVKGYQQDGPLKFSAKPVSLLDVAPTIAGFAGLKTNPFEGTPVSELVEGQERERSYFFYRFSGWDSKYLTDFEVFKIDGDVYDETAWTKTGMLQVTFARNEEDYVLGKTIRYGSDLKLDADYMNAFLNDAHYNYFPSHLAAPNGRIDLTLTLSTPLEPHRIYKLEIDLATGDRAMDVVLELDDDIPSSLKVKGKNSTQRVFFESKQLKLNDRVEVHLYTPDSTESGRVLLMSKLRLEEVQLPELGNTSVIDFARNLDHFNAKGVWPAEWWGRWTSKTETSLTFQAGETFCRDSHMLLDIKKFFTDINPDSFQVSLNGIKLETVKVEKIKGQGLKYRLDCSSFMDSPNQIMELIIRTDKVTSPLSLGRSGDPRTLGVGLVRMSFIARDQEKKVNNEIDER